MDVFLNDLSKPAPKNNVMPICMIRNLSTVLKGITTFGCVETYSCDTHSLIHITYFRLFADITNEHYLIHTLNSEFLPYLNRRT